MSQHAVLRFQYPHFDEKEFQTAIDSLRPTSYSLSAKQEDAPHTTHCVSAIRYAIEKASWISLPRFFVGDFARGMISYNFLNARLVPLVEQDRWDLIFFMRRSIGYKAFMITHVGIFMDESGNYFHSTLGGWKIENISSRINDWTIATCSQLSRFTDPRSNYWERYKN